MVAFNGKLITTTASLIEQTVPNYSIIIDDLYIGNPVDAIDTLTIFAVPYTYVPTNPPATSTVLSTSSIIVGQFSVLNTFVAVNEEDAYRLPTSAFIYAQTATGTVSLTYGKRYVYYRE